MAAKVTVVVVEDEPDLADLVATYCRREGWDVFLASEGQRALEVIRSHRPDMVILDIGLPGDIDGLEVCRQLRQYSSVPVLFLTARDDEVDRILGLELGADDYVTKPFSPREVVARIKAVLRRGSAQPDGPPTSGTFGSVEIDAGAREARLDGDEVVLAAQEWQLLELFLANPGRALSRQQLLDGAWGIDWIGDPRTVDVHVRQLRKKLGEDLPLATIRGTGYRFG